MPCPEVVVVPRAVAAKSGSAKLPRNSLAEAVADLEEAGVFSRPDWLRHGPGWLTWLSAVAYRIRWPAAARAGR